MDSTIGAQNNQLVARSNPPSAASVNEEVHSILDRAKVFVLDPDFILVFTVAILTDAMDILLHPTGAGLFVTIPIDIAVFFLMMAWGLFRGQRVENAKEEAHTLLEQYINAAEGKAVKRTRRLRYASRAVRTRFFARVLRRVGLAAVVSFIPFLGMIPWWTILVILALRERITLSAQTGQPQTAPRIRIPAPEGWTQRLSGLATPPSRALRPGRESDRLSSREERRLETGQTAAQPKISPTAARLASRTTEETPTVTPSTGSVSQPQAPPLAGGTERPNGLPTPPTSGPRPPEQTGAQITPSLPVTEQQQAAAQGGTSAPKGLVKRLISRVTPSAPSPRQPKPDQQDEQTPLKSEETPSVTPSGGSTSPPQASPLA